VVDRLAIDAVVVGMDEGGGERLERQAGAEVVEGAAAANDPLLAFEVALLADRLPLRMRQVLRVDDGGVELVENGLGRGAGGDMAFGGAVAALAADA
jgi:hypothetical protein